MGHFQNKFAVKCQSLSIMKTLLCVSFCFVALVTHCVGSDAAAVDLTPLLEGTRVLLVTGIDYPGHLWRQTAPALKGVLEKDPRLKVRIVEDPDVLASPQLQSWDAVVLHFMNWEKPSPGAAARQNLRRFVESGKGLMLVHFACGAWQDWPQFRDLVGRVYDPTARPHDPYGAFRVEIADPGHPITQGMSAFETTDELYTCLTGSGPIKIVASARSKVDGKDYPMAFVLTYGKGRVFHTVLGHNMSALTNSAVPELLGRGCAWAAGLPVSPARSK
jgi:type 1 glutamine amidotransferase